MNNMSSMFGLLAIIAGLYCLNAYYKLKFKGEITKEILLPENVDVNKCKNFKEYAKEVEKPILILGIAGLLIGIAIFAITYASGDGNLIAALLGVLFVAIIIFIVWTRKINNKYFDMKK